MMKRNRMRMKTNGFVMAPISSLEGAKAGRQSSTITRGLDGGPPLIKTKISISVRCASDG